MKLFMASITAIRLENNVPVVGHTPAIVQTDGVLAETLCILKAARLFPPGEGWTAHDCNLEEISNRPLDGCWLVEVPDETDDE